MRQRRTRASQGWSTAASISSITTTKDNSILKIATFDSTTPRYFEDDNFDQGDNIDLNNSLPSDNDSETGVITYQAPDSSVVEVTYSAEETGGVLGCNFSGTY